VEAKSLKTEYKNNLQIEEDLKHIPRGIKGSPQNMLRLYYQDVRKHDITKTAKTKEDTLRELLVRMKKEYPDFQPEYDHDYFKL
jgi:hypothetical protein